MFVAERTIIVVPERVPTLPLMLHTGIGIVSGLAEDQIPVAVKPSLFLPIASLPQLVLVVLSPLQAFKAASLKAAIVPLPSLP